MAKESVNSFKCQESTAQYLKSEGESKAQSSPGSSVKSSIKSSPIPTVKINDGDDSSIASEDSDVGANSSLESWSNLETDAVVINEHNEVENGDLDLSGSQPQIGSIVVQNSADITFGNKTFITGQNITINRCGHSDHPSKDDILKNTQINFGFECDGECIRFFRKAQLIAIQSSFIRPIIVLQSHYQIKQQITNW